MIDDFEQYIRKHPWIVPLMMFTAAFIAGVVAALLVR